MARSVRGAALAAGLMLVTAGSPAATIADPDGSAAGDPADQEFSLEPAPAVENGEDSQSASANSPGDKGTDDGSGPTAAGTLMRGGDVLEQEVEQLQSEIGVMRAVGEGMLLVLAACEEEPHCVTGVARREVSKLLMKIEQRIAVLQDESSLSREYGPVLTGYIELRDLFGRVASQFREVQQTVQVDELEGSWRDHFTADNLIEGAENLDFLNEHVSLDRFEDVDEPLPIH